MLVRFVGYNAGNHYRKMIRGVTIVLSVVDDGIVMSRHGALIATVRVEGIPFETADDEFLDRRADQLNVFLRMIAAEDTANQIHRVRRFVRDRL